MLRGFEQLLELLYDAPLGADGFAPFLDSLTRMTDSRAASFKWMADGDTHLLATGFEPSVVETYATHFVDLDPFAGKADVNGADVYGGELVSRRVVENSAFYSDFGRHHGYVDLHKMTFGSLETKQNVSLALLKSEAIDPTNRIADEERRLTRRLMPHISRALAIAELTRNAKRETSVEEVLGTRYGLTAAERVVVLRISRGESPRQIADAIGSSWHTVRTHLRSAFAKTGVNRQSALARLVASL